MPWWFPVLMGILALGCFAASAWTFGKVRKMRAEAERSRKWPTAGGTVTASYVGTIQRDAGEGGTVDVEVACVRYGYSVGGQDYQSDRIGTGGFFEGKRKVLDEFLAQYPVGRSVPVSYDPQDPKMAVLRPGEAGGDSGQYKFAAIMAAIVGVLIVCAVLYTAFKA
jgi:hypothetical protein